MKTIPRCLSVMCLLALFSAAPAAASPLPEISCGQTLTTNTSLTADLSCPESSEFALIIGAPNLTLDLGGYVLSGHATSKGVYAQDQSGVVIRNGTIEGFHDGVFLNNVQAATLEDLFIRNMDISDPDLFIFGVTIFGSQDVAIRDSRFEFPFVFHKEAVEVYESDVAVSNIQVHGGGVGVNFSYAGDCDPLNRPSNGTVVDSHFSELRGAGIWSACSSSALVAGNYFATSSAGLGVGIQVDAPFPGAVSGLRVEGNTLHGFYTGVELRGGSGTTIADNLIFDNSIQIALKPSLGCLVPESGEPCFYSTANLVSGNQTWGSDPDLYHDEYSLGNTWVGNACQTRDGAEIPACLPPAPALTINYPGGMPGSYFTILGANFPPSSTAAIQVNGSTLGSLPTNAEGYLTFLLHTGLAGEGNYVLTVSVNPSVCLGFALASGDLLRPQDGSGTVFEIPAGLALDHRLFLPLLSR